MSITGHFWTLYPHLRAVLPRVAGRPLPAVPWSISIRDPHHGSVRLRGSLTEVEGASAAVIVVHGLGGSPASPSSRAAVRALTRAGFTTLDLALRGADLAGEDIYHGGLWTDLDAVVAALDRFPRVFVCGFSVGGHVALRLAAESTNPRLAGVAAVCPPLDLAVARRFLDERASRLYRGNVLAGLRAQYAAVAAADRGTAPWTEVRRVRRLEDWDRLTVVPRFGFRDPADYYERESVAPALGALRAPVLLVLAENDPIVPAAVVAPFVPASSDVDVRWVRRGGHLGFPRDLDLGFGGDRGLAAQIARWFALR